MNDADSVRKAIEAAAEALRYEDLWPQMSQGREAARIAVEAAAPILREAGWNDKFWHDLSEANLDCREGAAVRSEEDANLMRQALEKILSLEAEVEHLQGLCHAYSDVVAEERDLADELAKALQELEEQTGQWTRKTQAAGDRWEEARRGQ